MQSRIIRRMIGAPWFVSNAQLREDLNLPSIADFVAKIAHNHTNGFSPDMLQDPRNPDPEDAPPRNRKRRHRRPLPGRHQPSSDPTRQNPGNSQPRRANQDQTPQGRTPISATTQDRGQPAPTTPGQEGPPNHGPSDTSAAAQEMDTLGHNTALQDPDQPPGDPIPGPSTAKRRKAAHPSPDPGGGNHPGHASPPVT